MYGSKVVRGFLEGLSGVSVAREVRKPHSAQQGGTKSKGKNMWCVCDVLLLSEYL
jgi:hypothetical protein